MKLGTDQLAHSVGIALNDHIPMAQTRVGALSDWKGLAAAEAGRNAVFAARLAQAGLTGPAPVFEGSSGFFAQVSGPAHVDVESFGRRGVQFRLHKCNLKPYPAVIYTQTAIVAGIEVAKEAGSLDRISSIDIATTRRGYQRTGSEPEKWSPKTRETADHSLPYITARAIFDCDITNESFAPQKFRDPAVLALMQKIKVAEDPALTARTGGAVPTRVTATLIDGRRISREVDYAQGFAERPMSSAEVEKGADGVDDSLAVFGRPALEKIARGFDLRGHEIRDVSVIPKLFADFAAQGESEIWNIQISDQVTAPVIRQTIKRGHGNM